MSDLSLISGRVRNLEIERLPGGPEDTPTDKFSCTVNDVFIEGAIHRVTFLEGENLDIVVRADDGKNLFEAARSKVQRKLWIPSSGYYWTGHIALLKVGVAWLLAPLLICLLAMGVIWELELSYFYLMMCGLTYAMIGFFVIFFQMLAYPDAKRTTALLTVLGYDNPAAQNLLLADREAERADPSIGPGYELATYRFRHR